MAVTGTTWSAKGGTSTTAELRALGAQFKAAIASAGMVQTTDTGQIDWTTINWITGAQTWGYEVWRFNDPLQATKPVFVRLLYTQTAQLMLNITAQVGTATDGAGNLTSAPNTNVSVTAASVICVNGSAATAATVAPFYVYGDGSSLTIASHPDRIAGATSGYGGLFFLERVRHLDGTPLGDAVIATWVSASSAIVSSQVVQLHNLYAQPGAVAAGWFPAVGNMPSSAVVGANMYTFPWFTGISPRLGAPSTMIIGHIRTDMSAGNTFTCDHYGAPRTFVSIAPAGANYGFQTAGNTLVIYPALRIS